MLPYLISITKKLKQMNIKKATQKSLNNFKIMIPILIGVLLLVNLITVASSDIYLKLFTGNYIKDSFIGALAGSVSFGIPVTSYIIGGELLKDGVSLLAVTAFILTWSTVGIAMLPLEISFLGKKFAIIRNIVNFIFAIVIAVLVVWILKII